MALQVLMVAAFVFIVCTLCVPVVKDCAKQSQLAQACWPGANDLIVRNKANRAGGLVCSVPARAYSELVGGTSRETPYGVTTNKGYRAKQSQCAEGHVGAKRLSERELCVQVWAAPVQKTKPITSIFERNALRRHYERGGMGTAHQRSGWRLPCQTKPIPKMGRCAKQSQFPPPGQRWAQPTLREQRIVRNKANVDVSALWAKRYEEEGGQAGVGGGSGRS
jgi:hypothetical protein